MAQFGRPSTDTVNEGYTDQAAGSVNIWQAIDEVVASDADYIQSALTPTSDVYATKLTTLEDPISSTGHIIRYRYRKDADVGDRIDLIVQLRQTYVSEVSQGTLITTITHADISGTGWIDGVINLTGAEADTITDYTNLYLRFVSNKV